jgi:hypothetical protein
MTAFGVDENKGEGSARRTWVVKCEKCRKVAASFDGVRNHRHNCDCDLEANARARAIMGLPANANFEAATQEQWRRLTRAISLGGMRTRPVEEIVAELDAAEAALSQPAAGGLAGPIEAVLARIELARSPEEPAAGAAAVADPPEFPEPEDAPEPETAIHEGTGESGSETEAQ